TELPVTAVRPTERFCTSKSRHQPRIVTAITVEASLASAVEQFLTTRLQL
ncbi:MAG: hypothetical protein ACI9EF_002781, partial [Pseudohongiellaceae bacterium]